MKNKCKYDSKWYVKQIFKGCVWHDIALNDQFLYFKCMCEENMGW